MPNHQQTTPVNTIENSTAAVQVDLNFQITSRQVLGQLLNVPENNALNYITSMANIGQKAEIYDFPYYIAGSESYNVNMGGVAIELKLSESDAFYKSVIKDFLEGELSALTGITFYEVASKNESLFDIGLFESDEKNRVDYYGQGGQDVLGARNLFGNGSERWGLLTYRPVPLDAGYTAEFSKARATRTIKHEILHGFGLSHPDSPNGFNPAYNDLDTLMSYNNTDPLPNSTLTTADKAATKQIMNRFLYGGSLTSLGKKSFNIDKSVAYHLDELGEFPNTISEPKSQGLKSNDKLAFFDDNDNVFFNPINRTFKTATGELSIDRNDDTSKENDLVIADPNQSLHISGDGDDLIYVFKGNTFVEPGDGKDTILLEKNNGSQNIILDGFSYEHDTVLNFELEDLLTVSNASLDSIGILQAGGNFIVTNGGDLLATVTSNITDVDAFASRIIFA